MYVHIQFQPPLQLLVYSPERGLCVLGIPLVGATNSSGYKWSITVLICICINIFECVYFPSFNLSEIN